MKSFLESIDKSEPGFKWGKLFYSKSHIWLFYCKDYNGNYIFCEGYNFPRMKNDEFHKKIMSECQFAVNNKPANQMSHGDTYESATFFVNPAMLKEYRVTKADIV